MKVACGHWGMVTVGLLVTIVAGGAAQYSGGTGEPNDPYQIATAADLLALGAEPNDYGRYFLLTADIDLDPNLPGGRVFGRAVIAPDIDPCDEYSYHQGPAFTGVFDGGGHVITRLTIRGIGYLGLFGRLSGGAEVRDLGIVDVNVSGSAANIGGLVGYNTAAVNQCYSTGTVTGKSSIGGLVGFNRTVVTNCSADCNVVGSDNVGGLVGNNEWGTIEGSRAGGRVRGSMDVGGLVGDNLMGTLVDCRSAGAVCGNWEVGGLLGDNTGGTVSRCCSDANVTTELSADAMGGLVGDNENWVSVIRDSYATGTVTGGPHGQNIGGLLGTNAGQVTNTYATGKVTGHDFVGGLVGLSETPVSGSFWDVQTSGLSTSADGTGKTTAEMQTARTFLAGRWDFIGETADGIEDLWWIEEGTGYPRLWWELPADEGAASDKD
jgi:hypothetical protein